MRRWPMNRGFGIFAQNTTAEGYECDYLRQAYALALSIKIHCGKDEKVFVMTDQEVPEKYKAVFDDVIEIPWGDMAEKSRWKIENRWKMYHMTPYEHTIVMDADCLVLKDISHWWNILKDREVCYASQPITYTGKAMTTNYYRKTFVANDLPMVYNTVHYFKKSERAKAFFEMVEIIVNHWEEFYLRYAPEHYQKWSSMDLNCAIAGKLLGMEDEIVDPNFIPFIHMKPHSQQWQQVPTKWTNVIGSYIDNSGTVKLGNHRIDDVLHYVEDEFLTDKKIETLEGLYQ
jgi:hypothetical protein